MLIVYLDRFNASTTHMTTASAMRPCATLPIDSKRRRVAVI